MQKTGPAIFRSEVEAPVRQKTAETIPRPPARGYIWPSRALPLSRTRILSEACRIGDRVCEMVLQTDEHVDWTGLSGMKEQRWNRTPAGIGLYSGISGILLFLAYLGKITGRVYYTSCARVACKALCATLKHTPTLAERPDIGAFEGIGSCIYVLSHLAALWHDLMLLKEATELAKFLPEWITQDEHFDIVAGSAGCIMSLLSLYNVSPSSSILTTALQCGDHLLTHARSVQPGLAWKTLQQEPPLAGFSHGVAGIALSLFKLADISGEERFRQAACEALVYERSLFSYEIGNWLDVRGISQEGQPETWGQKAHHAMSWSHGAPGIALARLASLPYLDDEITRQEIARALMTVLEKGFGYQHRHVGPNHSLAHGDAGNLETLLVAARTLETPLLYIALESIAAQLLESMRACGRMMGVPLKVETPGFMTGLSGIGYELLRLLEPDSVPSVLLLADPCVRMEA